MSLPVLNLAHRPFVNRKPVRRVQRILWSVIAVLVILNAFLYVKNRRDSSDLRERATAVRTGIAGETKAVRELLNRLGRMNPERQNSRVDFLNQKIAQRTFPWGRLFDRLSSILPPMVRLRTLDPAVGRDSIRRTILGGSGGPQPVVLAINGVAASDEDLYSLIDAFFSHAAFGEPKLRSERATEAGEVAFSLTVEYDPWMEDEVDAADEVEAAIEEVAAQ